MSSTENPLIEIPEIGNLVELHAACLSSIRHGFSELLNGKHLYQHVDIDPKEITRKIKSSILGLRPPETMTYMVEKADWFIAGSSGIPTKLHDNQAMISLPIIKTYCDFCRGRFPANQSPDGPSVPSMVRLNQALQLFSIPLICQSCRRGIVTFLVAREHARLTLAGRFPIERIEVPRHFPKNVRAFYSDAILAFNSDQVLPALFMLRTLIEQFMRSKVAGDFKRGEDLSKAYKDTLPEGFKAQFPTLADSYEALSEVLHSANADSDLFRAQLDRIDEHFDARRLHKLDLPQHKAGER
jgi:hypothetical protein